MIRTLLTLSAIFLSADCASMEISRVAGCSGDVLRLRGDIEEGDYIRFRSHFSAQRRVLGIDLSSKGGKLDEGFQIAIFTRQKRLTTYVSGECDSACAFIFLASRRRYVSESATIGVHSVSNGHGGEDVKTIRDTIYLARLSAKLGIPLSTIGRMVTTPAGKISFLNEDDLLALKAIVRDPFEGIVGEKNSPENCSTNQTKSASNLKQSAPKAISHSTTD
ncbi:hypothetical protein [Bradyrhizobium neotropicale]|uniref:hypothetical protein n=1 Tax=Bradyrhizobium neotropicale TaxID=1497615 RepID=UPI001AD64CAF|nr:hypothetical protein [Bradyrhizobium neotropicale]MBO4225558.1 hypothetical protein [Bradyrhizobium neotropicale]